METLKRPTLVHDTTVIDRREVAADVVVLGLNAPHLARVTKPGHFLMAVPPRGESPATALGVYEIDGERVSILFFVCGVRTRELATLAIGDRLACFGPLGNGFDHSRDVRDVAIVAGGVGIASVLLSAQVLRRRGARVRLLYGARSADRLVEARRFADEGCEVLVATDDGSAGHHGVVTEVLANLEAPDEILACGPSPMLRAVARIAADRAIPAQLSLEETFACGVGGCWGCTVPLAASSAQAPNFPPTANGVVNARICKEGPVFWASDLRW